MIIKVLSGYEIVLWVPKSHGRAFVSANEKGE